MAANVEVVGVYSRNDQRSRKLSRQSGASVRFASMEALLNEVDAIHVCTPPVTHAPIAIAGLACDKFVICEKPLTGYFGDGRPDFHWDRADKQTALAIPLDNVEQVLEAERKSKGRLLYAENWVYAPSIQKEREILEKTGAQILWVHGEESHSGSHSVDYAHAARCGGGVLIGKGCHPLTAALYLKRVEGRVRDGRPIRPNGSPPECMPSRGSRPSATRAISGRTITILTTSLWYTWSSKTARLPRSSRPTSCSGASTIGWKSGEQPPDSLQYQPEHGHANVQSTGRLFPGCLRGRENRHEAGLGLHVTGRGLVHRLSPRDGGIQIPGDRVRRSCGK